MDFVVPPAAAGLAITIITLLFLVVRRYQRLSHVPGPFFASLTDLWLFWRTWKGDYYHDMITDLHERYGPVVRWGPNRLSFADATAMPGIYGTQEVWVKAPSYQPLVIMANGQEVRTLLTLRDEKRVSAVKRHMSGGFSQSAFLRQEDQIDLHLKELLRALHKIGPTSFNLSKYLKLWSADTINEVAFSDHLGYLASGKENEEIVRGSQERFSHWRTWFALPTLERIIFKNPLAERLGASKSILADMATRRIQERMNDEKADLNKDLMGRFLAASENHPESISRRDVLSFTISTIHAGSETTSTTSSLILINLLRNPESLRRLEEEILSAKLPVPASFESVMRLPYLDGVIRESMRLLATSPNPKEKTVPGAGATISGVWVPGGTDVSISETNLHHDPTVWGPTHEYFRPERWIEADEHATRKMDSAHMGFSAGRRMCIGQHLARIEMKKLLASLITTFKISLADVPEPVRLGWYQNTRDIKLQVMLEAR